jgi:hypothetical protein
VVSVEGQQGGEIQIMLARRYDVVLWSRADVPEPGRDAFRAKLMEHGFYVREQLIPAHRQTNALFAGTSVPFTAIEQVIKAASEAGVPLKTVQHKTALKSGNQFEIQMGDSPSCNSANAPAIPAEAIEQLVNAASQAEFDKVAAPFESCAPVQRRAPAKKR